MQPDLGPGVAIIGGGITGITTALLLQVIGYKTVVYARLLPSYNANAVQTPEFATPHAAASILPHSVSSPNVARWTSISQAFFRALSFRACCGVRRQTHYEVFEDRIEAMPAYAEAVDNFERLTSAELTEQWVPRRSGARETHGWKFDAFFCDAPDYISHLYALYAHLGGSVRDASRDGGLADYLELRHGIYVNCTGLDAHSFLRSVIADPRFSDAPMQPGFEPLADPLPRKLIRGHYLRIDINQVPLGHQGRFFSYNYKPTSSVYQTASGTAADVYCYPRSDAWILGGSRQEGAIDDKGNWAGEQSVGEEIEFPRPGAAPLAVPSAILNLNADILLRMTSGQLDLKRLVRDDPTVVAPGVGYRFVRDSETDNVRIGCSRVTFSGAQKYILHNYGHGGSGFTLSWGCAFDILRLLDRVTGSPPKLEIPRERTKFATHYAATQQLLLSLVARLG
jgi:D-amino-acid oxidase